MADTTSWTTPSTTSEAEPQLCSICSQQASNVCQSCHCSRYCSKDCQKLDWPSHKLICKAFKDASDPPSPDHYRGVFFDVRGPKPTFVWLHQTILEEHDAIGARFTIRIGYDKVPGCTTPPFDQGKQLEYMYSLTKNWVLDRTHTPIEVLGRLGPRDADDGLRRLTGPLNNSVTKIDPELIEFIAGPLLFYGKLHHLDTTSFRHIVDKLRVSYGETFAGSLGSGNVDGVRINCVGDVSVSLRPPIEPFKLNRDFLTTEGTSALPIGEKVGIPLVCGCVEYALTWRSRHVSNTINPTLVELTPRPLDVQWVRRWLRRDLKPPHPAHVAALMAYLDVLCTYDGLPELAAHMSFEEGRVLFAQRDRFLLEKASEDGFRVFWRFWWNVNGRLRYSGVASPYNV
jgi:hypothetical protein